MSLDSALAFLDAVPGDGALRLRLASLQGASAVRDLAAIAQEVGFDFSAEEYRAAVAERAEGALSPESLAETAREIGLTD